MTKHTPATPLPWIAMHYGDGTVRTRNNWGDGVGNLVAESASQEHPVAKVANAYYIAHAANAYPKLVEALRTVLPALWNDNAVCKVYEKERDAGEALLHSLGEE